MVNFSITLLLAGAAVATVSAAPIVLQARGPTDSHATTSGGMIPTTSHKSTKSSQPSGTLARRGLSGDDDFESYVRRGSSDSTSSSDKSKSNFIKRRELADEFEYIRRGSSNSASSTDRSKSNTIRRRELAGDLKSYVRRGSSDFTDTIKRREFNDGGALFARSGDGEGSSSFSGLGSILKSSVLGGGGGSGSSSGGITDAIKSAVVSGVFKNAMGGSLKIRELAAELESLVRRDTSDSTDKPKRSAIKRRELAEHPQELVRRERPEDLVLLARELNSDAGFELSRRDYDELEARDFDEVFESRGLDDAPEDLLSRDDVEDLVLQARNSAEQY